MAEKNVPSREERARLNRELAQMLKGGVIMDVTTPEQARIAEAAGACAVMALERIPADIRAAGGVSRMSDPAMIRGIQEAVSIPVMAKCRIGHIAEAQILQAIDIDYIDESEVLSPADDVYHIDKTRFDVPFVCGARDLGEALRRVAEGATMIRTKGEPGTGDVVQAVRHMRKICRQIREVVSLREDELFEAARDLAVPVELVRYVHQNGKLPVVNFAAGGVATPADAALMMQLGAEGVFVGSGSSRAATPPSVRPPSSRPLPTTRTPRLSPSYPRTWARPWSESTPTRSSSSWRSVDASGRHRRGPGRPGRLCRARAHALSARAEMRGAPAGLRPGPGL